MGNRSKMRIAGACLNQTPMDWADNVANILDVISQARDESVDILCLPELCITGYGCEDMFLSEWLPQKALDQLDRIIPQTLGMAVTVGLPFIFEGKCYNTIAILINGRVAGLYAKHNLANDGVHYEPRWFYSWPYGRIEEIEICGQKTRFGSFTLDILGINTGFEICEDAWQEDRPACYFANQEIELILNPSASHFAFSKEEYRENLVVESSRQFDCVYLYANLLGNEAGRMIYDGDILIANRGQLIGHNRRLSFRSNNLLSLDFDFEHKAGDQKIKSDRSDALDEFGRAVPLALFDYLRKSKSKGFVLSLSGGADSSSIATLVYLMVKNGIDELGMTLFCEKLGITKESSIKKITKKLLITAYQGTVNSSNETLESAQSLAQSLSATFYQWQIDEEVASYTHKIEQAIGRKLSWEKDDISLQNIQARARSPIIWMLANLDRHLLLTTSNRSEGDVGYATMDGDTSGSISPIAAVDKHFILKWLAYAEKELGIEGLKHVNQLQPTAELRPKSASQTDEDDLMPYQVLVAIEREAIRNRKSPIEVYQFLKSSYPSQSLKDWISKFYRLWAINQWKRERIAPSFHVDDFNVDPRTWCRFPILSSGFKEELEELRALD
jgi:NAD+ synthase (glutamine-hydrolysing)